MHRLLYIIVFLAFVCPTICAQTAGMLAPDGPGKDAHWTTAAKDGFGTSTTRASKVWFTLADGVLTEVYYPTLDTPNVQNLQFVVVTDTTIEAETSDTFHQTQLLDGLSLSFRQINTAKSGNYKLTKTYITDPDHNTILLNVEFETRTPANVFVYYDPSLNNSGMHDTAWSDGHTLLSVDGDKASALVSDCGFAPRTQERVSLSSGFLGVNDGLTALRGGRGRVGAVYNRAEDGNVVQLAALRGFLSLDRQNAGGPALAQCTLALGFGRSPAEAVRESRASLAKGFKQVQRQYRAGWEQFLRRLPKVQGTYERQFGVSAMVLHALEDKTYRGATIASPSIPWGGGPNANEPTTTGYHAVWARDLYHIATALIALGDFAGANRALDYLFNRQQMVDGSFPQNSRVDGHPIGRGIQMDQVALPIVLALELGRTDGRTWERQVRPAADFIVQHGPATNQDRWEEKSGYSPATIAAEIAGLVCAAKIARINRRADLAAAYLKKADNWSANVERWTATSTGVYGDGSYYLRLSDNDNPNDGAKMEINSGGGVYDERAIVDAGFLEFVRLGIRRPDDPLVLKSIQIIDKILKETTPFGDAYYRYNHDAYGERADGQPYDGRSGQGRLWSLLTGERGEYELARGNLRKADESLNALRRFANEGLMIPEQVWDREHSPAPDLRFGRGTGSATPLAWSLAQFIRLAMNLKAGRNLETPRAVAQRYSRHVSTKPRH
jgi:glucoamylase